MGGGVAGIAAAVRLAEAGAAVTLIETRKRLGGRATSHIDRATGGLIDNCQHVLMGCCTNLVDLYARLGVSDRIEWHDTLHFAAKPGQTWTLGADPLPAPLHLTRAMLRFRGLSLRDRLGVARAMRAMMRERREAHRDRPFAEWLASQGQSSASVERFWNLIVAGACNLRVDRVAAHHAMQVFQEGFIGHRDAYVMGVSTVPLAMLYDGVAPLLAGAGGRVLLGVGARGLRYDAGRIAGIDLPDDRTLTADLYISALPFDRLARISPHQLTDADERLNGLDRLSVSPIIGIHLWLDRRITDLPHLFFVDSPLDWIFRPEHLGPRSDEGQHLHAGISAAEGWVAESTESILQLSMNELGQYSEVLDGADTAQLVRGHVIRERRATFAAVPGADDLRPGPVGQTENLLLAGAWTATGWPATMEGAVRSGYAAAGAALGRDLRVADLPISRLNRWLGLGRAADH
jgi:zeta-carotene desaturase